MAHRLSPRADDPYLSPKEVVRRLREEFDFVDADPEAGADHVGDMIVQFLRMGVPDTVVEAHRQVQSAAIRVTIADNLVDDMELSFVTMPGEGLLVGYYSGEHEEATSELLRCCADALGYETELV